jgi:hypothetical protein
LIDQLRLTLDADEADRVASAVDEWLLLDMPDGGDDTIIEEMKAFDRARWARVAKLARDLHDELHGTDGSTPLVNVFGTPFGDDHRCPPVATLDALARYAGEASQVPPRPRGPRRLEWRDELVSLVWAHYPESKRALTDNSPFEKTIKLLFGFVGERSIEDLHREIRRILARSPTAPFVVER